MRVDATKHLPHNLNNTTRMKCACSLDEHVNDLEIIIISALIRKVPLDTHKLWSTSTRLESIVEFPEPSGSYVINAWMPKICKSNFLAQLHGRMQNRGHPFLMRTFKRKR